MTNEEARAILEEVETIDDSMYQYNPAYLEALNMAIAALKAEHSEDAVKRESVLNTLDAMDAALDENRTVEAYKELLKECYKALPSVTPERQNGEWIDSTTPCIGSWKKYCCSECGRTVFIDTYNDETVQDKYPFCHCGADMRKKERANET